MRNSGRLLPCGRAGRSVEAAGYRPYSPAGCLPGLRLLVRPAQRARPGRQQLPEILLRAAADPRRASPEDSGTCGRTQACLNGLKARLWQPWPAKWPTSGGTPASHGVTAHQAAEAAQRTAAALTDSDQRAQAPSRPSTKRTPGHHTKGSGHQGQQPLADIAFRDCLRVVVSYVSASSGSVCAGRRASRYSCRGSADGRLMSPLRTRSRCRAIAGQWAVQAERERSCGHRRGQDMTLGRGTLPAPAGLRRPPGRQPRCPAHDMSQPGQETGPRTSSSGSPGTTERAGPHHIASETRKLHPREQPTRPPTRPTALRDTAAGKPVARNCGAPGSGRCAAARQAARSRRRESCSLLLQLNSEGTLLIRASQGCSLGSARSVRQWSR